MNKKWQATFHFMYHLRNRNLEHCNWHVRSDFYGNVHLFTPQVSDRVKRWTINVTKCVIYLNCQRLGIGEFTNSDGIFIAWTLITKHYFCCKFWEFIVESLFYLIVKIASTTDEDRPSVNNKFLFIFPIFLNLLPTRLMFEWTGVLI